MIPLKYATASQEIPLGPFVDDSDGVSGETGLTIANTDILLWKNGATSLASKNSGGATHIQDGIYYATLDATDTNTYGPLTIFVQVLGALAVKVQCWVMEADAYNALFAASGTGHIDTDVEATADQVWDEAKAGHTASGSFGEEVQDHALYSEVPTVDEIADQVWDEAKAGHTNAGTFGIELQTRPTAAENADAIWDEARLTHVGTGSFGKIVNEIYDDTDVLSASGIADAVWDEALSGHTGSGSTGEALDNMSGGSSPEDIADAVWDEDLTGHTDADSAGKMLQDIPGAQKGAIEYTYTITDGSNPVEGAEVWISTDSNGANVVWYGTSDASGVARASNNEKPWLDAGTYYGWVQHGTYSWSNPDTLTVS